MLQFAFWWELYLYLLNCISDLAYLVLKNDGCILLGCDKIRGTLQGNCTDPRASRPGSVMQVWPTGAGLGARRQDDAAAHLGRNTSIRALFRQAVQAWRRLAVRWGSMWLSGVSLSRGSTRSRLAAFPRYGSSSTPTWWPAGSWNWPGGSVDGGSVLSREPKETDSAGPWEGPAPRTGNNAFY